MTGPEFVYETYIRAAPGDVWKALTSAEFTSRYFYATRVESSWQPGDPVYYRYEDGETAAVEGEVIDAEPPHRLVISWHVLYDEAAAKEAPSRVAFHLKAMNGQTRLRIVHDRFPGESVVFDGIRSGWPWILAGLKSLLETGEALPAVRTAQQSPGR